MKKEWVSEKVWRFLDFTKFVDMLDKRALHFTRIDKLKDPYEGSYPKKHLENLSNIDISKDEVAAFQADAEKRAVLRRYIVVNCWHMNPYESAAMWDLYVGSNTGVAIQTTGKKLSDCFLSKSNDLLGANITRGIGPVSYVDFENDAPPIGIVGVSGIKRKSFEHERELRLVLWRNKKRKIDEVECFPEDGFDLPIDLDLLIERIHISPLAKPWFLSLVKSISQRYKIEKEILHSDLYSGSPLY